jgi:hypothetical protein
MESMNDRVATTRNYLVLYSITRMEYYEFEAASPEEARQRAFCDGKLMDAGETTDVTFYDIEDITATVQRCSDGSSSKRNGTRDTPAGRSLRSNRRPA